MFFEFATGSYRGQSQGCDKKRHPDLNPRGAMKPTFPKKPQPAGFALVVTLALMILLTVVAVGLLSLATISLRTSSLGAAEAKARSNAKLALMLAIGRLQTELGPDQRVSANGAILSDTTVNHPHWTGVWNSWQAGAAGTAAGPDTPSEHRTIAGASNSGMNPTYRTNREDHFRSWLVSLDPEDEAQLSSATTLTLDGSSMPGKNSNAVQLVGEGTLGTTSLAGDHVSARLIAVRSGASAPTGRYGWWVGDESQKARILSDTYESGTALTLAEKVFRHQAPGSTGTKTVKGLEAITKDQQLTSLPTLQTLDIVDGATTEAAENYHDISAYSYGVLADVREGGLKRDLSTLLERPISVSETGDDFMLYKFNTKDNWMSGADNQECVPIQDLAAFYQLYDGNRTSWKDGVKYSSNLLGNGMQVVSPNFGVAADNVTFNREYTTLYRQPAVIKVQFLLSMFAKPSTTTAGNYELLVGITPSITLWNPTNVPMIMRFDAKDPDFNAQLMRLGNLPLRISWIKNKGQTGQFISTPQHLPWFTGSFDGNKPNIFSLYFSGKNSIRFGPGEVRSFSLPYSGDASNVKTDGKLGGNWTSAAAMKNFFFKTDRYFEGHEVVAGWEPESFILFNNSAPGGAPNVVNNRLVFKQGDNISFEITGDNPSGAMGKADLSNGGAFSFIFIQSNYQDYRYASWGRRHYRFNSRQGQGGSQDAFNQDLFTMGFPGKKKVITAGSRSAANLITRSNTMAGWPFMQFSLQAGAETNEASNGGVAGGRKFAGRPFLHSSALAPPYIDDKTGNSLYDSGWNWSIDPINDVFEAPVQVSADDDGYYGGGYTPESGTTHVVQQEIPVVPPISIAELSHAHLGGFSIADESAGGSYFNQNVTATGQAGLFPHTIQAIGNSYAHPSLAADKAYATVPRTFFEGDTKNITFADHSYLANKALWDEFFFSSISPQPSSVKIFGSTSNLDAKTVASNFFLDHTPLPNRRMVPYKDGPDQTLLDSLYSANSVRQFSDGLADKIAAHLMVKGPFNINSTSVEAWKVHLSSLKGKPVAYLDKDKALSGGVKLDETTPVGTPVGPSSLPNGKSYKGSTTSPADPEQWTGWRELTDQEIGELATAVVKQVKLRGPFLSLSEFVNRRLDSGDPDLSAMGALQAAIDDGNVSINAGFRSSTRKFSSAEISSMNPAFPQALQGPVAYGSSAYVDQADILRNCAGQLTPRGDTFVIRTYGDSLDPSGNVESRAWCEAVVQRVPEYLNATDEPRLKQSDLQSAANKTFGRKFQVVSFRWLNDKEV